MHTLSWYCHKHDCTDDQRERATGRHAEEAALDGLYSRVYCRDVGKQRIIDLTYASNNHGFVNGVRQVIRL